MGFFDWGNDSSTENTSTSLTEIFNTTSTTNNAEDNRVAAQDSYFVDGAGGLRIETKTETVNNEIDNGAVDRALKGMEDAVQKASDLMKAGDATAASGYTSLLGASNSMFTASADLFKEVFSGGLTMVKDVTAATTGAYRDAVTTTQATIDNKTIVTLGLAAAAAFGIWAYSKKKG